ncbi:hypothetical protein BDF19DRAFT_435398 [Syncephalis fuscata]|nr:hypothetical protein BDF19DRAFT_435398 [Syncephalis fuscata]
MQCCTEISQIAYKRCLTRSFSAGTRPVRQNLSFLLESQTEMIQSLAKLPRTKDKSPSVARTGRRNPKIRRPIITDTIDIPTSDDLSLRRVRHLARITKKHGFYDLDAIWTAYMAVHNDSNALAQVSPALFAAIRDLMHQTVDVLGLAAAASRVCLVSADQAAMGVSMTELDHITHMWGLYQLRRYNEIEANNDIWHFRLTALLGANRLEQVINIARKRYLAENQPLDACTAASLLIHMIRKNQIERAIMILHQMHPLPENMLPNNLEPNDSIKFNLGDSVFAHNVLLAEFAKYDRLSITQWLLTRMRERCITALPFSITSMLNAVAQSNKVTSAMLRMMFAEISTLCPKLDVIGYNMFTYHFIRRGDKEEAYEVLAKMRMANVYPDEHTFSILVQACVRQKDWDAAKTLLGQMRSLNMTPSADLYGILLGGYARARDIAGVEQSLVVWNCAMSLVARSNNLAGTIHVLNCIRKLELSPDKYTFWWIFYAYRWTICRVQRDFNRSNSVPIPLEAYNVSDSDLQLPFILLAELKKQQIPVDTKLAYLINFVLYRISQLAGLKSKSLNQNNTDCLKIE